MSIALSRESTQNDLLVPRAFLTDYMPSANGEYVKIYLYLLQTMQSGSELSMSKMADFFDVTEKDILRALKYWNKNGVIDLTLEDKAVTGIKILAPWNEKSEVTSPEINVAPETATLEKKVEPIAEELPRYTVTSEMQDSASKDKKFNELLQLAEIYFKTPIIDIDYERLIGVYFQMGQNFDACEVMIEDCVGKRGNPLIRLEKLACTCIEEGLMDANSIRAYLSRNKHYKLVKEALGVSSKVLAKSEKDFVHNWFETLGFSEEMVSDACARAVRNTETGRFEYTDKILRDWHEKKIHTLSQVAKEDAAHKKSFEKSSKAKSSSSRGRSTTNKFNDFEQREIDFDEMEAMVFNYKG